MKPILFSTPMVQAILAGRKTQTRRIVKPQPSSGIRKSVFVKSGLEDGHGREIKPRYQPSDILWVRETWGKDENGEYVYRTNYGTTEDDSFPPSMFKWKPSIHMPREAARIFLRVTNVKVERLQDITEEDARAEGCSTKILNDGWKNIGTLTARDEFITLWEHLNAKRGLGWDRNPWVWVVAFEKISKEEAERLEGLK